jgi:hypothetical protein
MTLTILKFLVRKNAHPAISLAVAASIFTGFPAFAQVPPPTDTEAFNLRVVCKQMADKKAEEKANLVAADKSTETVFERHASRYDPNANRCYIDLHEQYRRKGRNEVLREVYDGQIDKPLAFTLSDNSELSGKVFDPNHTATNDENGGYDDAVSYMDAMMGIHIWMR